MGRDSEWEGIAWDRQEVKGDTEKEDYYNLIEN